MVGDTVEQRAGEALAGEDRGPFLEGQVRGDDGGAVLVAPAEDVEQELASGLRQRHVSELVDDQQADSGELALEAEQPLLVTRLDHLVDQVGGGGEVHGEAPLAGGEAEGQSDVRLAHAARAEQDRVLAALDVIAACEVQHQHLVEARDGLEVGALELLDDREPGLPDAALDQATLDQATLAVDHLHLYQSGQKLHMIQALGRALAREFLVFPQEGRQLELLQMMFEQDVGRLSHGRPLRRAGSGQATRPTCNVVPAPEVYASAANEDCLVQDIEGAKRLLDEAGWRPGPDGVRQEDGIRLSILYQTSTNAVRQDFQALIKQWWSEIGIEVELRDIDASVFFGGDPDSPDTYQKFFADIEMYANNFEGADPEPYLGGWRCGNEPRPASQWRGANVPRYCSEEYDRLLGEMAKTGDLGERARLAKAMNDMLVQDHVLIPLVHRGRVSAHAHSLGGVLLNTWDSELWNIADWHRIR